MSKKFIKFNKTDGFSFDVDMLSIYKENENFENIKEKIIEMLLKDNRYKNYDVEKIKLSIKNTERNSDVYYVWNVGGKPYRVGLLLESRA